MASIRPVLTSANAFNLDLFATSIVRCVRRGTFVTAPIVTGTSNITRGCNLFAISKHPCDEPDGVSDEPAFSGFPEIGYLYVNIGGGVFRFRAPAGCFTPIQTGSSSLKLDLPTFPVRIAVGSSYWLPDDSPIARDSSAMSGFTLEVNMSGTFDLSTGDVQMSSTIVALDEAGQRFVGMADISVDFEGIWVK